MTEIEIRNEARNYMEIPPIRAAIKCGDLEDLESHIKVAFANGARWALENQWHDAKKDLPCEDKNNISSFKWQTKKVLVIDVYDNLYIDTMIYDADKKLWFWESSENKPKYWQIPELPNNKQL